MPTSGPTLRRTVDVSYRCSQMQEQLADWNKECITNPVSSLRMKYNDARVLTELTKFVEIKEPWGRVATFKEQLLNLHSC